MRWSLLHRVEVGVPLIVAVLSRPTFAQGWIVPRPCGIGIIPVEGRPAVAPPIRDCRQNIARTRSDVRVELADRVLRYEVEERSSIAAEWSARPTTCFRCRRTRPSRI
jgi:hypothetical protein